MFYKKMTTLLQDMANSLLPYKGIKKDTNIKLGNTGYILVSFHIRDDLGDFYYDILDNVIVTLDGNNFDGSFYKDVSLNDLMNHQKGLYDYVFWIVDLILSNIS